MLSIDLLSWFYLLFETINLESWIDNEKYFGASSNTGLMKYFSEAQAQAQSPKPWVIEQLC